MTKSLEEGGSHGDCVVPPIAEGAVRRRDNFGVFCILEMCSMDAFTPTIWATPYQHKIY